MCECGVTITLTICGDGRRDQAGRLTAVTCPSRLCAPAPLHTWVALVDDRITSHQGWWPGHCPYTNARVIDDLSDIARDTAGTEVSEVGRPDNPSPGHFWTTSTAHVSARSARSVPTTGLVS